MRERFIFPKGAEPLLPRTVTVSNDRAFEVAVLGAVRDSVVGLGAEGGMPEISLTPKAADRGRDIVVRDYPGDELLGLSIEPVSRKKSVYIECKLSGRRRLTLDHTAANVLQLEHEPDSIFLLVTNATLTPRALCTITRQCERLGVRFHLIDAWNFEESLLALSDGPGGSGPAPPLLVSYQILKDDQHSNQYLVHFVLRSFAPTRSSFEIAFNSTRDWKGVGDSHGRFDLARGGLATWTLVLTPSGPKLPSSFSVALEIDGRREIHRISLLTRDEMIRLPLFPSDMSRCLQELRQRLSDDTLDPEPCFHWLPVYPDRTERCANRHGNEQLRQLETYVDRLIRLDGFENDVRKRARRKESL